MQKLSTYLRSYIYPSVCLFILITEICDFICETFFKSCSDMLKNWIM